MKILILNSGSSSVKFQLRNCENGEILAKGMAERVSTPNTMITFKTSKNKLEISKEANHEEAIQVILKMMKDDTFGVIKSLDEIDAIGHRVVHGGEMYCKPMLIDDQVIDGIRKCNVLAPLHNPACLLGIHAARKLMPGKPNVAVFDTAFHQSMKRERFLYPIWREAYEKYGVRKYGFHGISHNYLSESLGEIIGQEEMKCINFHLGQGASLCAVKDGKSIDTTMGLSPLSGIIMGTRCGDIDPSFVSFFANVANMHHEDVVDKLNKESGMLALSGVSSDFRDILKEAENGNEDCKTALKTYYENVAGYAGKLSVALHGAKQFVFAGGVGENSPIIRAGICKELDSLGVELDDNLNNQAVGGKKMKISSRHSKIDVFVIPTNEELMIARQTLQIIENKK